ncbi:MAG: response regulator [Myxococcota bacterium]
MKRIALIEDNEDNRLLVEVLLSDRFQLDEYEDGRSGMAGLRSNKPDLVLLDISLPFQSGIEVLQEIRADASLADLPVIALTAHAMADDKEEFLSKGFDAYVSKPILDERILFEAIDKLLAAGPEPH